MNIIQLYKDFSIPYWDSGNNVGPGWVNVRCCWCDDSSNHLGFNLKNSYFKCWRCGWRPLAETITRLTGVSHDITWELIRQYEGTPTKKISIENTLDKKPFKLPSSCGPLSLSHKQYLAGRKFDPDKLEREWNLLGTGPISLLEGTDYKHRIVAPIRWDNQMVSFQGRDITGRAKLRYKACPKEREINHHKHILYGDQNHWAETGICVEGITDVWRLGPRAFATFGIEFTLQQVITIVKHFKKVVVLFDTESQAQAQANKLVAELRFRSIDAYVSNLIHSDPAEMPQEEADQLVKNL